MPRRRPGWTPIFRPETRQINNLGSGFDSIKTGKTLRGKQAMAHDRGDHDPMPVRGSCMPHSVLSISFQRPERISPLRDGMVQGQHPMDR